MTTSQASEYSAGGSVSWSESPALKNSALPQAVRGSYEHRELGVVDEPTRWEPWTPLGVWLVDEEGVAELAAVVVGNRLPDHAAEVVTTASLTLGGSGTCTAFVSSVHFSSSRTQSLVHHDVRL